MLTWLEPATKEVEESRLEVKVKVELPEPVKEDFGKALICRGSDQDFRCTNLRDNFWWTERVYRYKALNTL